MCHHYLAGGNRTRESRNLAVEWNDEFSIRSNHYQMLLPETGFYPLDVVPHIRLDDAGERTMLPAQWGFLPSWWKPSDATPKRTTFQRKCYNARSEDIESKPSYRHAFRKQRCLLPAVEFSEKKHYFRLRSDDRRPFAMAGIWDRWLGADGDIVETCTILTTAANKLVQEIGHHRMPVVLRTEEEFQTWLNPEFTERGPLKKLMRPASIDDWVSSQAGHSPEGGEGNVRQNMLF